MIYHIQLPPRVSTVVEYFQGACFRRYQILDLLILQRFRRQVRAEKSKCAFLVENLGDILCVPEDTPFDALKEKLEFILTLAYHNTQWT